MAEKAQRTGDDVEVPPRTHDRAVDGGRKQGPGTSCEHERSCAVHKLFRVDLVFAPLERAFCDDLQKRYAGAEAIPQCTMCDAHHSDKNLCTPNYEPKGG